MRIVKGSIKKIYRDKSRDFNLEAPRTIGAVFVRKLALHDSEGGA